MEGDIPTSIHPPEVDSPSDELFRGDQDVFRPPAFAQGEHRLVLQQQQKVRDRACLAQAHQVLLQGPDLAIGMQAQVSHPQNLLGLAHPFT
jgi:hypothetical protein